jgi:WD40 repeat protein
LIDNINGSDDDYSNDETNIDLEENDHDDASGNENIDEHRTKVAKELLDRLMKATAASAQSDDDDEDEVDESLLHDQVSSKLRDSALAERGQLFRLIGSYISSHGLLENPSREFKRGHNLPVTCITLSRDGKVAFSGSKDCRIIRWDLASGVKTEYPGRRKTKGDIKKQLALARKRDLNATRPVVVAGYGGGRIGSTTDEKGGLAKLTAPKIIREAGTGGASIIIPAASLQKKLNVDKSAQGADGEAAGDDAGLDDDAKKKAALLRLRNVPDYHIAGHFDDILSIALSSDDSFLVSGGKDRFLRVWDPMAPVNIENFVGHKDAITGLAFQHNSHTVYSASMDRTVKLWSLDALSYTDTLFGHQSGINGIDALHSSSKERLLTVGSDRTARMWKVVEGTQLVFRSNASDISTDVVASVCESVFLTGGADGSLSLWHTNKKRPVYTLSNAHGDGKQAPKEARLLFSQQAGLESAAEDENACISYSTGMRTDDLFAGYCNWITAITHMPGSDVIATGSGDGFVRFWRLAPPGGGLARKELDSIDIKEAGAIFSSLVLIGTVHVRGIVNGLCFSSDKSTLVAAVGQEHRLGRWFSYKQAKNGVLVVKIEINL